MTGLHFVRQYEYRTLCGIRTDDRAAYPHVNVLHDTYHPTPVCPECAEAKNPQLTVGSLFSGIGGIDLGLERVGMRVIWQAEVDPYCSRVLAKHWPDVPNLGDVTSIDWSSVERPDVLCGGYPCQPFSHAGSRRGNADERHLWPHMLDAIRVLRPRYVLIENVAGHLSLGFDRVLADLASIGFDAEWSVVHACAMGAPHSRPRLFVVAYPASVDAPSEVPRVPHVRDRWTEPRGSGGAASGEGRWLPEPAVDRMADGVPRRMVRGPLHGLGNAVVPQVAEFVGRMIVNASTPQQT